MQAAPMRYLGAAFWPVAIWTSLAHLDEHPADDYVERTSPIVATAIEFWLCVAGLIAVALMSGRVLGVGSDDGVVSVALTRQDNMFDVLWLIAPALYVIGFWLYAAREDRYRR